ncbi:ATPase family AAA domain-containing protein 3A-like [Apiospora rasikravindrae]|uniref:ATPase family AAA domain-containing protein 3A-like n=1 Tax=Apiospora rasikravindrae TaxID=990691 RepID=A0ABR1U303_9PEZI
MDTSANLGSATESLKGAMPLSGTMVEETFTADMKPGAPAAEAGKAAGGVGGKTGKPVDEVKEQGLDGCKKKKKMKKANKAKSKAGKKKVAMARDDDSSSNDSETAEHTAESTSDDSDDSDSDSDSEAVSDSEPEVEVVRKSKVVKKRQLTRKTQPQQQQRKDKSSPKSTKKTKKQQLKARAEVDSEESDFGGQENVDDSDLDEVDEHDKVEGAYPPQDIMLAQISQELRQVTQVQLKQQQQLDQLQRIITAAGIGSMGNAGGLFNPFAANAGLLNQGLLGSNSSTMGLAGLGQQNAVGGGLVGSGTVGRGGVRGAGRDIPIGGGSRAAGVRNTRSQYLDDDDEDEDDAVLVGGGGGRGLGRSSLGLLTNNKRAGAASSSNNKGKKTQKLEFKRVDQVWDSQIHNYKLQDTAKNASDAHYNEYLFHVRRTFDWENKFKATVVDIKSKKLRECLQEVIGTVKGVSLVEETPKLDPNMLFLYLEDLREHLRKLKDAVVEAKSKKERKKQQAWVADKRRYLKVLIKYLDKDYAHVKKNLYPLLENGLITFDLLWALWKPNTLVFTTTYGSPEEHRVFKAEMAEKRYSMLKGETYYVEGKVRIVPALLAHILFSAAPFLNLILLSHIYANHHPAQYFEYDGKNFGFGAMAEELPDFQGSRRIDSLACYPLAYHKDESGVRRNLIERGKKFVSLGGVHYKCHQGLAYYKKKKSVVRVEVNSRVMVDPAIHRRNNPNYPISLVRPKVEDIFGGDSEEEEEEEDSDGCDHHHGGGLANGALQPAIGGGGGGSNESGEESVKMVTVYIKNKAGKLEGHVVPADEADSFVPKEQLDKVEGQGHKDDDPKKDKATATGTTATASKIPEFSDEEYLIASPVVLGFAFGEKLWLEFTVSGIKDIVWNEHAYDSLVREPNKKEIVQALVESHKYHPTESIDDVIQGKGKGLVAVLHGPPGTGKTLTAEGISELLRCPLYNVSAGDLGTDSRYLEAELQKTLDICHAWGAILLLDEADVFLEKRNMADIHRNALVSIFLRQLEYFQGILFLTTNRVESFDEAFLSRMHIPLRYDELDNKARKAVFKMFIERVRNNGAATDTATTLPSATAANTEDGDCEVAPSSSSSAGGAGGEGANRVAEFTDEDYNELARYSLNGRQIKNTVITAHRVARQKNEPLGMRQIRNYLGVVMDFERDIKGGPGYQDAMRSYF